MERRFDPKALSLAVLLVLTATLFLPGLSFAEPAKSDEPEVEAKAVEVKLNDLEMLDQDGRKVRFRSDVVRDRIVVIDQGSVVDKATLLKAGLVKGKRMAVKLLGHGEIKHAVDVKVNSVSRSAREKIEAAGGKVEVLQ